MIDMAKQLNKDKKAETKKELTPLEQYAKKLEEKERRAHIRARVREGAQRQRRGQGDEGQLGPPGAAGRTRQIQLRPRQEKTYVIKDGEDRDIIYRMTNSDEKGRIVGPDRNLTIFSPDGSINADAILKGIGPNSILYKKLSVRQAFEKFATDSKSFRLFGFLSKKGADKSELERTLHNMRSILGRLGMGSKEVKIDENYSMAR